MWGSVIGWLGKILWSQRHRLKPKATDEELRAVARGAWSQHRLGADVPFSVVQGWARDHLTEMGYQLDDDTDERMLDALDQERARLRIPAQLDELQRATRDVAGEFDRAEREGRERITGPDNGDKKKGK